jgi:hypothetical protein
LEYAEKYMADCSACVEPETFLAFAEKSQVQTNGVGVNWTSIDGSSTEDECEIDPREVTTFRQEDMARAQDQDQVLGKVKQWVNEGQRPSVETFRKANPVCRAWMRDWERLSIDNLGVLWRSCNLQDCSKVQQMCLPKIYRERMKNYIRRWDTRGSIEFYL